jgi:hypothetical protein
MKDLLATLGVPVGLWLVVTMLLIGALYLLPYVGNPPLAHSFVMALIAIPISMLLRHVWKRIFP